MQTKRLEQKVMSGRVMTGIPGRKVGALHGESSSGTCESAAGDNCRGHRIQFFPTVKTAMCVNDVCQQASRSDKSGLDSWVKLVGPSVIRAPDHHKRLATPERSRRSGGSPRSFFVVAIDLRHRFRLETFQLSVLSKARRDRSI
jgi:hypothetical protein